MKAIGNINYAPDLTEFEKSIILNSKGERFADIYMNDKQALTASMLKFISDCVKDLAHHNITEQQVRHIAENIGVEIINNNQFVNLKVAEVKDAIKRGVRGEFGEQIGMSIVNIHKWLKGFINDEKRKEAIKKQVNYEHELSEAVKIDPEKANAEFWAKEKLRIEKFKKTGELDIHTPRLHLEVYEDAGKIKLTKKQKWFYYESSLINLIDKLQVKTFAPHQRKEFKENNYKVNLLKLELNNLIKYNKETLINNQMKYESLLPEELKSEVIQLACLNIFRNYFLNM
jgi:hypothetical protein